MSGDRHLTENCIIIHKQVDGVPRYIQLTNSEGTCPLLVSHDVPVHTDYPTIGIGVVADFKGEGRALSLEYVSVHRQNVTSGGDGDELHYIRSQDIVDCEVNKPMEQMLLPFINPSHQFAWTVSKV